MSNYIYVNHSKFESTAKSIETYISKHKKNIASAGEAVATLSSTWQGKDSTQFQNQWNKVDDKNSTSEKMNESLEDYAKFLRYAAGQYKNAQSKAVNLANQLLY